LLRGRRRCTPARRHEEGQRGGYAGLA